MEHNEGLRLLHLLRQDLELGWRAPSTKQQLMKAVEYAFELAETEEILQTKERINSLEKELETAMATIVDLTNALNDYQTKSAQVLAEKDSEITTDTKQIADLEAHPIPDDLVQKIKDATASLPAIATTPPTPAETTAASATVASDVTKTEPGTPATGTESAQPNPAEAATAVAPVQTVGDGRQTESGSSLTGTVASGPQPSDTANTSNLTTEAPVLPPSTIGNQVTSDVSSAPTPEVLAAQAQNPIISNGS